VQAVVVTSANAPPALPREFHARPLLAVGDATAAAARGAGFRFVHSAGADAVALGALSARICAPGGQKLLLASGEGQGMALAADLRQRGFRVVRRCVYAAVPAPVMPAPALAALAAGRVTHALFFSAASARAFVSLMRGRQELAAGVEALAIAPGTATALTVMPWRRIRVASHPNQDELLALLE
jgi:uroporphyrinogen-III synthase